MDQRMTLLTLGVADVPRATAFYERLGWRRSSASVASTAFFDLGGIVLALWGRDALAEDARVAPDTAAGGFAGVALALNLPDHGSVDATLAEAAAAGGRLVKPAEETFWGGYSGYFADPDGHLWEIAFNPHWPLDADGRLRLPQ
jgi:catechol 2,3-dioxygenase-like lactoylglutathione lyase family enzyme